VKTLRRDRRSQRTHRLLAEALVALLHKHRYTDLTVQAILDRANIGRTTFYSHYWDKDDLLASEMERVVEVLWHHSPSNATDQEFVFPSLGMFQHLQEQYVLYRALVRSQAIDLVWAAMKKRLTEQVEDHFRLVQRKPIHDLAVRVTAQAVVGTFLSLLQWWLENEMPLSPAQMAAYFYQLLLPGVQAMLHSEA
jgi:AcrR family transcriptional regulator